MFAKAFVCLRVGASVCLCVCVWVCLRVGVWVCKCVFACKCVFVCVGECSELWMPIQNRTERVPTWKIVVHHGQKLLKQFRCHRHGNMLHPFQLHIAPTPTWPLSQLHRRVPVPPPALAILCGSPRAGDQQTPSCRTAIELHHALQSSAGTCPNTPESAPLWDQNTGRHHRPAHIAVQTRAPPTADSPW